jgi:hypothetical protein
LKTRFSFDSGSPIIRSPLVDVFYRRSRKTSRAKWLGRLCIKLWVVKNIYTENALQFPNLKKNVFHQIVGNIKSSLIPQSVQNLFYRTNDSTLFCAQ